MNRYTLEPNLFKISVSKNVVLKSFSLGSLSNWSKDLPDKNSEYLCEINVRCGDFTLPDSWCFRKGNYFLSDETWYFHRRVVGVDLKFKFDASTSTFIYYPRFLGLIPFIYNSFYPIGYEISNLLILQMLRIGYIVLRSAAFNYLGKNILLISPGYNGKTTIVKNMVNDFKEEVRYISEDVVFLSKDNIIGIPPDIENFGRKSNRDFKLTQKEMLLMSSKPDYVIFYLASDVDQCVNIVKTPNFPALEYYTYFTKSLATSIMYYEDFPNVLETQNLFGDILSKAKVYRITTEGHNSSKFKELLDGVIK